VGADKTGDERRGVSTLHAVSRVFTEYYATFSSKRLMSYWRTICIIFEMKDYCKTELRNLGL
jgi:hypothetical protein